jgi:hypothetical protein
MTEREEAAIEMLLSDPRVVAWLDADTGTNEEADDEDDAPRAA